MEIKIAAPYSTPSKLVLRNVVPTSISPTLYGLLYSVVMFLQQRTKDIGTNNPIDQGVDMYISMMLLLLLLLLMLLLKMMLLLMTWSCSKDEVRPANQNLYK